MKKIIFTILGIVLIAISTVMILNSRNEKKPKEKVVETAKQVDNIDKYGYVLYDNTSKLYHEKFGELKNVLNAKEFDEKAYAKVVAEMFAVDFYDLNTKVSNTDIGGLIFVHPKAKDDFIRTATDTMYKYVETNVYGNRKQDLPSVKSATATVTDHVVPFEKARDEKGYQASIVLTYEKELGYPTEVKVSLVHYEDKLYIVEVK
jgi:hypothetical protein